MFLISVAWSAELSRAPYLQMATPTSTVVVWRTEEVSQGEVRYGRDPALLDRSIRDRSLTIQHEVRIDDLTPGERVWYAVFDGHGNQLAGGADYFIDPIPAEQEHVRVWVVGDSGTGTAFQTQTRDAMATHLGEDRADLFVHVGDMAYSSGTTREFDENFYGIYTETLRNTPIWPAIGNHEGRESNSLRETGPYYDGYVLPTAGEAGGLASGTEAYYSFDVGPVHFIALDSQGVDRRPNSPMMTWLRQDTAATDQPWMVAFWHHPPYTDGSHDSDVEFQHIEMRENAVPILEEAGVDLVLGGHSHIYERSYLIDGAYETPTTGQGILDRGSGRPGADGPYEKEPGVANDGALYVVAGHGGTGNSGRGAHPVMAFDDLMNGSVILDIHPERLTIRNVRMNGIVSDEAVLVKGDALVLVEPDGDLPLLAGHGKAVRWWSPDDAPVDISWTCDGETWEVLAEGVQGGRWEWSVPDVRSPGAWLRIEDTQGRVDESDARFTVRKTGTRVLPYGTAWRYWDQDDWPGARWAEVDFDDEGWPVGQAEFGVGDGDEETRLDPRDDVRTSLYARHTFQVPATVTRAELSVLYDDAVGVFLNGHLVLEENLVNLKPTSWAEDEDTDNSVEDGAIDPALFVEGENVLAVVVKNAEGSADTSFDLQLTLELEDADLDLVACGEELPGPVGVPPDEGCGSTTGGRRQLAWLAVPLLLLGVGRRWR